MSSSKERRRLRRPGHGTVVAYVALFAAISGTAVALPGSNSVNSGDIINGQVKTPDLKGNAVKTTKIAPGQVRSSDLRSDAVSSPKVLDESLTGADVQNSSLSKADTDGSVQDSCTLGAVVGHALVDGAGVGAAYGSAGVAERFNCGGANAVAKRNAAGDYNVCFPSSFPRVVLVSAITNGTAGKEDNIISWRRVNDAQCAGNVAVNVRVRDNGGALEDSSFTALLLNT